MQYDEQKEKRGVITSVKEVERIMTTMATKF